MRPASSTFYRRGLVIGLLLLWQIGAYAQSDTDSPVVDSITEQTRVAIESVVQDEESSDDEQQRVPDTIVLRRVPDSVMQELRRDKEFEYANNPDYWKKAPPKEPEPQGDGLFSQSWFNYLVILIMIGVLLFAIFKIAESNNLFMRRGLRQYDTEGEEMMSEDDNLDELTARAEQQGNYRLAVRYRYRKTLKDMDARQLIRLDPKRTNWDYVSSLGTHPLKKQFLLLTRAYEYVWYGEFDINEGQYGYLKTEFQQFKNSLG